VIIKIKIQFLLINMQKDIGILNSQILDLPH